jgi:glycosyltransferase involved in cell wall biosynthesis
MDRHIANGKYMKIDVVLLTKNSLTPCLKECVDSIYTNIPVNRLIVVDGGSVDGTLNLLQKYPDVELIDDIGGTRATARQKGISAVKTEWHIHVDSDVILCKDWFKKAWRLVDENVGAVWGAAVPNEKHFFNITYAMSKFYRIGIKELLVKQIRSERAMMHDTLIRTTVVEDIKIPANLHIWEDEYIGRHIISKGYKFLKVIEPFCLHNLTPKDRYEGFIMTGYLLKQYRLWNLRHVLSRLLIALPKAAWIYAVTKDFQASKLHLLNIILLFKGWLMH